MSDISKCSGDKCPLKDKCYRFTSKASSLWQSDIDPPPFTIKKKKFKCDLFWGEQSQAIIKELNAILKGEK